MNKKIHRSAIAAASSSYLRVSEKNYERVPVPEGAISAEILAMNSNDQYIMRIYRPNLMKKAPAVLLDSETYYVSTYKYYPLKDIEARFFRKRPDGRCAISEWLFDENGDLVAHQPEGSHLLIQPAPHIVKHINFENASE